MKSFQKRKENRIFYVRKRGRLRGFGMGGVIQKYPGVENYAPSVFKCRVARIFPSPGCKDPSYRMKKFLTYIWEYFLRTGGCHFYPLLIPKVTFFVA